ncbi:MAG: hypothetical protein J7L96_08150 [Bacteroidales bacterium]|nr:hypothetical protein [Bacteroidales bacterium]
MKEYPPYKVFISFIWVLVVLVLFQMLIGKQSFEVGGQLLHLPNLSIRGSAISKGPVISAPVNQLADESEETQPSSTQYQRSIKSPDLTHPVSLEIQKGNNGGVNHFYKSLFNTLNSGGKTRILYYGDSQIEGDRIVKYLRKNFQERFGGFGTGLQSFAEPVYTSLVYENNYSHNLEKTIVIDKQSLAKSNHFGVGLSYCTFSGSNAHSSFVLRKPVDAMLLIQNGFLFIESPDGVTNVKIASNGMVFEKSIAPVSGIQCVPFSLSRIVSDIRVSLSSDAQPIIHGLSFESESGVIVDDIPLRGSAGLEFSHVDPAFYQKHFQILNPQLIILHFGINVVPARRSDFDYYRQLLVREIKAIKTMSGDVPILIIGVSDMARVRSNNVSSYKSVVKVSQAMREAAKETGSLFFDLLSYMGGTGACKRWEGALPPLIRKDFIHFTIPGGALVADGIFSALMQGYNDFLKKGEYAK